MIKAVSKKNKVMKAGKERVQHEIETHVDYEEDGVFGDAVIVLFPRNTWDEVLNLAKDANLRSSELISEALAFYKESFNA